MTNYAESLTAIRKRISSSMADFAHLLGYKNASSIQRYFSDEFKDKPLPDKFVLKLFVHAVDKGDPKVTRDEIEALGHANPTTIQSWKRKGFIPTEHHQAVFDACVANDIEVTAEDFLAVEQLRQQAVPAE